MKSRHWTYEECKMVALESKTKTELFKNYRRVYDVIYKIYFHIKQFKIIRIIYSD